MDDIIVKLIGIIERFGPPGAVVFALLWYLRGKEIERLQAALADSQEKRIAQAMTVTAIVESCRAQLAVVTEALKGTQSTIAQLLQRIGPGGRNGGN